MATALLTQLLIKYLNMAFYRKTSLDLLNIAEKIFLKLNEDLFMKKSKSFSPEIGQAGKPKHCIVFLTSLAHFLMCDKMPYRRKTSSQIQKQLLDKSVNLHHLKTELNHLNDRLFLSIHKLCWEII